MTSLEHASQLVAESLCGLYGHEWGEVEKVPDNPRALLDIMGAGLERYTCRRCGRIHSSTSLSRMWDRRAIKQALEPTIFDLIRSSLDKPIMRIRE